MFRVVVTIPEIRIVSRKASRHRNCVCFLILLKRKNDCRNKFYLRYVHLIREQNKSDKI